jgi:hypothetical protein
VDRARTYGEAAADVMKTFPRSDMRSALLGAVDFSITRAH